MTSPLDGFVINDSRERIKPYGCPAVVTNGWRKEHVQERTWRNPRTGDVLPTIHLTVPAQPLYSGAQIVTKERYRFGTFSSLVQPWSHRLDVMRAMFLYSFETEDEIDVEFNSDGNMRFTVYKGAKEVDHFIAAPSAPKTAFVETGLVPTGIHWEEDYLRFTIHNRTVWTCVTAIRSPMHLIFNTYEPTYKNPDGGPHEATDFVIVGHSIRGNIVA